MQRFTLLTETPVTLRLLEVYILVDFPFLKHDTSTVLLFRPGLGSLSPSKDKSLGAETNCFTPGFKLSSANGQSNPCVDSSSIVGAGGKIFSSAIEG